MTMVGFSGLSFEDQMLEFERQARLEAERREAEQRRADAERAAAIAAARAREEAAARIAAQQESDRLARIDATRRAAARAAAARAREEAAALEASRLESSSRSARATKPRKPRLADILAGVAPEAESPPARTPAKPVTPATPAGPIALGGFEMAAASLQAEADVRRRNASLRRAFDVVPGGPQVRAQIEALVAKSPPRPPSRAVDLVEERSRDVENRAITATLPMGEEAFDSFTRERDLALLNQELLRTLPLEARPDEAPTSGGRPPLLSPGAEPVSDFEAFASFREGERRITDAQSEVQRATGAARAADVADDLEEQSALDAAFRRELLGEVGGAALIRAMDAEAADLEAAHRREMVADPGGAAVPRARGAQPPVVPDAAPPVVAYRTVTYDLFAEDLGGEDGPINRFFEDVDRFRHHLNFGRTHGDVGRTYFGLGSPGDLSFGLIPGAPTYELFTHRVIVTQLQDADGNFRTEVAQDALNEEAGWRLTDKRRHETNGNPTEQLVYAHYDVDGASPFETSKADVTVTVIDSGSGGVPRFVQEIRWEAGLKPEIVEAVKLVRDLLPNGTPMSEIAEAAGLPELADLFEVLSPESILSGVVEWTHRRYVDDAPGLSAKPRPVQVSPWVTLPHTSDP